MNRNKHQTFIKDRLVVWLLLFMQSGWLTNTAMLWPCGGLTYIQFELNEAVARRLMKFLRFFYFSLFFYFFSSRFSPLSLSLSCPLVCILLFPFFSIELPLLLYLPYVHTITLLRPLLLRQKFSFPLSIYPPLFLSISSIRYLALFYLLFTDRFSFSFSLSSSKTKDLKNLYIRTTWKYVSPAVVVNWNGATVHEGTRRYIGMMMLIGRGKEYGNDRS